MQACVLAVSLADMILIAGGLVLCDMLMRDGCVLTISRYGLRPTAHCGGGIHHFSAVFFRVA